MYISSRAAFIRNVALSIVNGAVTLIILLIAPLGLAAVIINTLLITVATYITATASDRIIVYLTPAEQQAQILRGQSDINRRDRHDLDQK